VIHPRFGNFILLGTVLVESDISELKDRIKTVIACGAVGINFEDQIIGGEGFYPIEDQCARIRAIREAAHKISIPLFINARTDVFLKTYPPGMMRLSWITRFGVPRLTPGLVQAGCFG
jgi:hypothetical protein